MFEGFRQQRYNVGDIAVNARVGGSGPPLLLLHGYPQTHVMWHKIASRLAERFTVVAADLRGYGDSDKPASDLRHETYSKRVMGQDMANLMDRLGFDKFSVAGHDRGARVTHRMALDHSDRLLRAVVLDIAPTRTMYRSTDMAFARAYYHWFFLIQPYDLPERLIGNDPDYFLEKKIAAWSRVEGCFTPEAVAEYKRCFRDAAGVHATCEDYRAGASIDLDHDEQDLDRKVECPFLVLWGARSIIGQTFDMLSVWGERAVDVRGRALDCGHFLPEEAPEETLEELLDFL